MRPGRKGVPVISEAVYDALLGELYAGAADQKRMTVFLNLLGEATRSHVTTFVRADLANPDQSALLAVGVAPEEVLNWSEHAGENPWMERYRPEIHAGGVCNGDAYVTQRELVRSQYYDGFLRHIDTRHSVGICAAYEQDRAAFLMLCRSAQAGVYDTACDQLFQRLAPHVVSAFELQRQFEHLDAQATQVNLRQRGMFLLDAQWNWVGGNTVAEQMVATGWWRGRERSPLEPVHAITRNAWSALQHNFDGGASLQQVVPVYDRAANLVAFASAHAYKAAAIGRHAPRYVLFVRPLHAVNTEALSAQLRNLFGFTSSESALALAMRSHGKTAAAATALGITDATARVRLQTIFQKTGTHRQADLLLMLDALAETVA